MQVIESHGARIPILGFGTMTLKDALCVELVEAALHLGYRHLDTAQMYGNEREVGEGMRRSGVKREDIFLTTKVWFTRLAAGDFERSVDESLERLGLPWVDLLMIHWPNAQVPLAQSVDTLCKVKRAGLAKHIGVANFNIAMLDEAIRLCPEPLVTLQVECHPYLDQSKVIAACRARGLVLTAYCPLARGRLQSDKVLAEIGHRHGKTFAQVALRWLIQQGVIAAIPRSSNPSRIAQNIDVFDFALSDDEMQRIGALRRPNGRIADPTGRAPVWDA
jgi:diketogulonate reductase-like aldo/keto reductase